LALLPSRVSRRALGRLFSTAAPHCACNHLHTRVNATNSTIPVSHRG
jgi:hypothetical protein